MEKYAALAQHEVSGALRELQGWSHSDGRLCKEFTFADFGAAMRFMQACIAPIERLDHHPTWSNTYATVHVQLTTHDAGDQVSGADVALAKAIDAVHASL